MMESSRYIDVIARTVMQHAEPDQQWEKINSEARVLYRIYALLVLAKGAETTDKDVHDAWAAWMVGHWPEHHSLVPFDELDESVQALDKPYGDAIRHVARLHAR